MVEEVRVLAVADPSKQVYHHVVLLYSGILLPTSNLRGSFFFSRGLLVHICVQYKGDQEFWLCSCKWRYPVNPVVVNKAPLLGVFTNSLYCSAHLSGVTGE